MCISVCDFKTSQPLQSLHTDTCVSGYTHTHTPMHTQCSDIKMMSLSYLYTATPQTYTHTCPFIIIKSKLPSIRPPPLHHKRTRRNQKAQRMWAATPRWGSKAEERASQKAMTPRLCPCREWNITPSKWKKPRMRAWGHSTLMSLTLPRWLSIFFLFPSFIFKLRIFNSWCPCKLHSRHFHVPDKGRWVHPPTTLCARTV